jgi:hypothetical protein
MNKLNSSHHHHRYRRRAVWTRTMIVQSYCLTMFKCGQNHYQKHVKQPGLTSICFHSKYCFTLSLFFIQLGKMNSMNIYKRYSFNQYYRTCVCVCLCHLLTRKKLARKKCLNSMMIFFYCRRRNSSRISAMISWLTLPDSMRSVK